jgi:NADH:ubiquinone oxidoreductase subunit 6 (subunit J)
VFIPAVIGRNVLIALAVGCVLSATNQWDAIVREPPNARLGAKIFANFLIPFVVSSVSAALNRRAGREK